jgi:hypothetical protein
MEGGGLIGPEGDPAGWKVLQPVKFKGKLFEAKEVEVECTVRRKILAKGLSKLILLVISLLSRLQ